MAGSVDPAFAKALPKVELHAHLSGSIDRKILHDIWALKQARGQCLGLENPLTAVQPGGEFVDVVSFFPLFDKYIYELVNDLETVKLATKSVIDDFAADGVAYLELRTTPRANAATGLTKEAYVAAVHDVVSEHNASRPSQVDDGGIEVRLILSIDRKISAEQAGEVVDLALEYQYAETRATSGARKAGIVTSPGYVVAIDLCGNPARGDVSIFRPAFKRAKTHGLGITVHFAEIPQSSTVDELDALLHWEPDRLGHVIHVSPDFKRIIRSRELGLELCLSCNVLAKLTTGGFAMHHFGDWLGMGCPIALSTDDVGIFGSPLSNEYLLASHHFELHPQDLVMLSKSAAQAAFSGTERMLELIKCFEQTYVP